MSINKLKNRNDIIILNGILRKYRDCKNNFFDLAIFPLIKKESINGDFFVQYQI